MRYAFVREGLVEFVEEGAESLAQKYHTGLLPYFVEVPQGVAVQVGDCYLDGVFSPPVTPWQHIQLQQQAEALEQQNQILQQAMVALMDAMTEQKEEMPW